MNARWIVLPFALVALGVALRAAAVPDEPHWASFATGECSACHTLHNATGAGLINQPTNFTLCDSCHSQPGTGARLGFPWGTADQATPGSGGIHHHWDSLANNPTYGATPPAPTSEMGKRVKNGYLQCSTCHNQHAANMANGGTQHTSIPVGLAQNSLAGGSGNCQLTLNQPATDAAPKGYLIELVGDPAAVPTIKFMFSNDGGISWFVEGGAACVGTYPACSNATQTGANKQLNDGSRVTVSFTSTGPCDGARAGNVPGDQWKFYVSYPFLRVSNVDSAMCVECHSSRNVTAAAGPGNGSTVFSHPVGVALSRSYDRTGAILDANGALQSTGDGNATNDLKLGTDGKVHCMTCHYPHNADSNSLTVDAR